MKKLGLITLSLITAVCMAFSVLTFVWNTAYASTGNITTDSNEQPLDSLVENGGLTSIFDKIAVVGDSLSSGALEDHQEVGMFAQDVMDYSWGQFMARTTGSTVYNFSRSGMSANEYCLSFAESKGFWSDDYQVDAYYIALGFNDLISYAGTPQGLTAGNVATDVNVSDYTQNATTFAGYMGQIISRYQAINENAAFFLITMPVDSSDTNRVNVQTAHQTVLRDLAETFANTYVIDLREYGPKYDADFVQNYYVGGHLSTSGYALTAKMVMSYTDYIIRHNTDAFRSLGLTIPEGYTHTVKPVTYDLGITPLKYQQLSEWNTAVLWSGVEDDVMTYVDAQWNQVNPGVSHAVAITFTAPSNGKITPNNGSICTVYRTNNNGADGVRVAVYLNDQKIFPANAMWQDPGYFDGTNGSAYSVFSDKEIELNKGDKLHFVVDNGGNGSTEYDSTYLVPGFFWTDDIYTNKWFDSASAWWTDETNGNTATSSLPEYLRKDIISYNALTISKNGILPVLGDQTETPLASDIIDGGLAEIIRTAGLITSESQAPAWLNEYGKITKTNIGIASESQAVQAYFIDSTVPATAVSSVVNGIFTELNSDAYVFLLATTEEQSTAFAQIANDTERVYLIDLYTYGEGTTDAEIAEEIAKYVDYIIRQNMADFNTFGVPKMPAPVDIVATQDKLLELGDLKYQKLPSYYGDQTNDYWTGAPNEDSIYLGPLWNTANPGATYALAVGYTAPIDGSVYPDSHGGMGGAYPTATSVDGARFAIYLNQTKIYPKDKDWATVGAESMNVMLDPFNMKAGDTLYYIVENGGNGDNNGDGVTMYIGFHWVDGVNNTKLKWFDSANGNGAWSTPASGEELNTLGFKKSETVSYHYAIVGNRYSINYELGGGVNAQNNPTCYSDESLTFALAEPTKDGYEFSGWTYQGVTQPTKEVYIENGTTGNLTFTANWTAIEYNVTYEMNGGINPTDNQDTFTVEDEFFFEMPVREGYTFSSWTIDGEEVTGIELGTIGDVTVTANWTPIVYVITYELDGGTNGNNPETYTIEDAITFANPTKTGYTFKGWKINGQDATGIALGTTGNITVTATWEVTPPAETPNPDPKPTPDKGGCGSSASGGIAISLIAMLGGVSLLIKKKKD